MKKVFLLIIVLLSFSLTNITNAHP